MNAKTEFKITIWVYEQPTKKSALTSTNGSVAPLQFRVFFKDIRYCTCHLVKKNYAKFVTLDNQSFYLETTLQKILVTSDQFTQTSKDTIVNIHHIDKRHQWLFVWSGEHKFNISKHYRSKVQVNINNLL